MKSYLSKRDKKILSSEKSEVPQDNVIQFSGQSERLSAQLNQLDYDDIYRRFKNKRRATVSYFLRTTRMVDEENKKRNLV